MRYGCPLAVLVALLVVGGGCSGEVEPSSDATQIRTIETEHLPASRIGDEGGDSATESTQDDVVALPFAPAISMDPVDGSKVSIRRTTPSTEYEGKVYHFSSEENLKLFLQDPTKYLSGSLATY